MKENESSVAVTEARHNLDSLLAGARLGRLTHIVKGSEILAHLVSNCQYLWIGVFQATSVPVC